MVLARAIMPRDGRLRFRFARDTADGYRAGHRTALRDHGIGRKRKHLPRYKPPSFRASTWGSFAQSIRSRGRIARAAHVATFPAPSALSDYPLGLVDPTGDFLFGRVDSRVAGRA